MLLFDKKINKNAYFECALCKQLAYPTFYHLYSFLFCINVFPLVHYYAVMLHTSKTIHYGNREQSDLMTLTITWKYSPILVLLRNGGFKTLLYSLFLGNIFIVKAAEPKKMCTLFIVTYNL